MSLRIGVVVHPRRDVSLALGQAQRFAQQSGLRLTQLSVDGEGQQVAPPGEVGDCDLVLAIGGDGTALAAIRTAAPTGVPMLGVACGSLGALTGTEAEHTGEALERVAAGEWRPIKLPALVVALQGDEPQLAYNDLAIVRRGQGQVRVSISVDGELYARLAGDGCIVSTPVGSSAYAFAAGGPLLAPGASAFLLTPLPTHGGSIPPLVIGAERRLELELPHSFAGARLELDGRILRHEAVPLSVTLHPDRATLVSFAGSEPFLTALRRRGVLRDSPRVLADDARQAGGTADTELGGLGETSPSSRS